MCSDPGPAFLVAPSHRLRLRIERDLDGSRCRAEDRLGRGEHRLVVDGTDDRERGVRGTPAAANLVEIVDGDRRDRFRRSEDRIREWMLGPVQGLGQELPDAPTLLGVVGELAQHDGTLAIEIGARRPGCRHAAECPSAAGTSAGTTMASRDVCSRVVVAPTSPPSASISRRASAPSRVRKIRCSCRCAAPRARPWREPTPIVSRTATTGPGRSRAATRRPASVRLTTGTGQPGVVVRASST